MAHTIGRSASSIRARSSQMTRWSDSSWSGNWSSTSYWEVICSNIDAPSCQHVLIVAPRGRGKTMLLARVGAELRTNDALSEHLFPVRFMEESHEIATLADFWLEALFYLAHANATSKPEFSRELLATHADLTARWRDTNIEGHARAAVLEAADRLGPEACPHGREPASSVQRRRQGLRLAASPDAAVGNSNHAACHCDQSVQRAG